MAVDDYSFASFAELLSVVAAALRLQAHLMKHARASPGGGCCDFAHSSHLRTLSVIPSICPSGQVFPNRNLAAAAPAAASAAFFNAYATRPRQDSGQQGNIPVLI